MTVAAPARPRRSKPNLTNYVSVRAAATRKGVSHEALRQAILRGDLKAMRVHGRLTLVHLEDLAGYTPQEDRQRAGRAGARARAKRSKVKRR